MSIARFATRSLNNVTFLRPFRPIVSRSLATNANEGKHHFTFPRFCSSIFSDCIITVNGIESNWADPNQNRSSFDSSDNLDSLFGDYTGNDEKSNDFFQHLSKAEKDKRDFNGYNRSGGSRYSGGGSMSKDETFDPSSDGVDGKLKEAALAYNMDEGDGFKEYSFRPDFNNSWGMNNFPRVWFLTVLLLTMFIIRFQVCYWISL